jgi:hypothetical protein
LNNINNNLIIGISAKKGGGKDLLYKRIIKHTGINFINLKFAEHIKSICSIISDLPIEYFYDKQFVNYEIKHLGSTVRSLQQKIGTEIFRDGFNENIWVNITENKINNEHINSNIIITDLRFMNEYNMIKNKHNHLLIRIDTDTNINTQEETHKSESELDSLNINWDYRFFNDKKDIECFDSNVSEILKLIYKKIEK